MRFIYPLFFVLWATCFSPLGNASAATALEPFQDPNPALIHWQGFSSLPPMEKGQMELLVRLTSGSASATPEQAAGLLHPAERALARFRRAASGAALCVWGTTVDEGPLAMMPHLPRMMEMCRLALLKADSLFTAGEPDEALQWVLAVRKAARQIATEHLLAEFIDQCAIENMAIHLTARHRFELPATSLARHQAELKNLPPLASLHDSVLGEKMVIRWIGHRYRQDAASVATTVPVSPSISASPNSAAAAAHQLAPAFITALQQQLETLYDRAATAVDQPWDTLQTDLAQLDAEAGQYQPLLGSILPSLRAPAAIERKTRTLQIMLDWLLSVDPNAETLPPPPKDAIWNKPLEIQTTEKEITLSTADPVNGKKAVLSAPRKLLPKAEP